MQIIFITFFIKKGEISILAPEIVLLYKSRNSENSDYQHDFDTVINNLDKERFDWFINAMNISYPKGHIWISKNPYEYINSHNSNIAN